MLSFQKLSGYDLPFDTATYLNHLSFIISIFSFEAIHASMTMVFS